MNKFLVVFFSVLVLVPLSILGYFAIAFGVFETTYSKQDLIDNYNLKTKEIEELRNYINTIVPKNKTVEIEFEGRKTLGIFHVIIDGKYDSNWNIKVNSAKTDTLLQKLGWTKETLFTLKEKLDNANCISVENGDPFTIGYQRSGMGMYFYKIFNRSLNDSLKKEFNDSCQYIFYRKNIVLEFGGGAIGVECFEDYRKGER
jgi:hypothetical protein